MAVFNGVGNLLLDVALPEAGIGEIGRRRAEGRAGGACHRVKMLKNESVERKDNDGCRRKNE